MTLFRRNRPDNANRLGLIFVLASAFALSVAWFSEHHLGLVPCALCLWERYPWRILIVIAVFLFVVPRRYAPPFAYAGLLCLGVSIALAGLHSGVEHHFWPSPLPECRAPVFQGGNFQSWMASLPQRPAKPCDEPDYIWKLPLSVTELGGLYALIVLIMGMNGASRLLRQLR